MLLVTFFLTPNFVHVAGLTRLKIKTCDVLQEDLKSDPWLCSCELFHRAERLLVRSEYSPALWIITVSLLCVTSQGCKSLYSNVMMWNRQSLSKYLKNCRVEIPVRVSFPQRSGSATLLHFSFQHATPQCYSTKPTWVPAGSPAARSPPRAFWLGCTGRWIWGYPTYFSVQLFHTTPSCSMVLRNPKVKLAWLQDSASSWLYH